MITQIMYQLCAGADDALVKLLRLRPAHTFTLLNPQLQGSGGTTSAGGDSSSCSIDGVDDAEEWDTTVAALELMGVDAEARAGMWRCVGAVLHLGELQFDTTAAGTTQVVGESKPPTQEAFSAAVMARRASLTLLQRKASVALDPSDVKLSGIAEDGEDGEDDGDDDARDGGHADSPATESALATVAALLGVPTGALHFALTNRMFQSGHGSTTTIPFTTEQVREPALQADTCCCCGHTQFLMQCVLSCCCGCCCFCNPTGSTRHGRAHQAAVRPPVLVAGGPHQQQHCATGSNGGQRPGPFHWLVGHFRV